MTKDETLKLALEALHGFIPYLPLNDEAQCGRYDKALTAIKEALANEALEKMAENARELGLDYEPEQEPVAWEQFYPEMGKPKLAYLPPTESPDNACYTPPQRTWVGLTDDEIVLISADCATTHQHTDIQFAKAIEAALKAKNT